jgi:hypothetical protein
MINEEQSTIKEKLDFYKGKNIELHIVKKDREWLNCFIVSAETPTVYIIKERKFGLMHIFIGEIFSVEELREEKR